MSNPNPKIIPPGFQFYPSEQHLLSYYLPHKRTDTIRDIDFYNYNPFDLPDSTCFRFGPRGKNRHWYCYTAALLAHPDRRRAGFGFWKRVGRVREVTSVGKGILGTKKCFVFYLETEFKTDWFMYEYALLDHIQASFVVCRVVVKSRRQNSASQNTLGSSTEKRVAKVRHIGIQHDENALCRLDEDKARKDYVKEMAVDEVTRLIEEIQPNNLVTSLGLSDGRHLSTFLEGDFLELDDLN